MASRLSEGRGVCCLGDDCRVSTSRSFAPFSIVSWVSAIKLFKREFSLLFVEMDAVQSDGNIIELGCLKKVFQVRQVQMYEIQQLIKDVEKYYLVFLLGKLDPRKFRVLTMFRYQMKKYRHIEYFHWKTEMTQKS